MGIHTSDLDHALSRKTLTDLNANQAVTLLEASVDAAWEVSNVDALRYIVGTLSATIDRTIAPSTVLCRLDYCLANAWDGIKHLSSKAPAGGWDWESEAVEQQTICIRRSIASDGFLQQPRTRVCQTFTNLANCYSTTGRFVEAIGDWDQALAIDPQFGMARGNRAVGLVTYAKAVYDGGHATLLARAAWSDLNPSKLKSLETGAGDYFARIREEIGHVIPKKTLTKRFDLNGFELGKSKAEQHYRAWCLENKLFLNPLNELGLVRIAARDILSCPSIVAKIGEGPRYHDFLNQIKQEYCSARWMIYEGSRQHSPHFSDKDVYLFNTLDYPSYGLRTEQLKLGFRAIYSLFDKMSFFMNAYLGLGIAERDVSFRSMWYVKQKRSSGIRPEFASRPNWPWRGLYWVGKDLYENSPGFREVIDPAARELNSVRNHLEHKYLKLHGEMWSGVKSSFFADGLGFSVSRDAFSEMTLRLLKMVRASIVYLILGVHREERDRAERRGPDKITPPMPLDKWEDDWKS